MPLGATHLKGSRSVENFLGPNSNSFESEDEHFNSLRPTDGNHLTSADAFYLRCPVSAVTVATVDERSTFGGSTDGLTTSCNHTILKGGASPRWRFQDLREGNVFEALISSVDPSPSSTGPLEPSANLANQSTVSKPASRSEVHSLESDIIDPFAHEPSPRAVEIPVSKAVAAIIILLDRNAIRMNVDNLFTLIHEPDWSLQSSVLYPFIRTDSDLMGNFRSLNYPICLMTTRLTCFTIRNPPSILDFYARWDVVGGFRIKSNAPQLGASDITNLAQLERERLSTPESLRRLALQKILIPSDLTAFHRLEELELSACKASYQVRYPQRLQRLILVELQLSHLPKCPILTDLLAVHHSLEHLEIRGCSIDFTWLNLSRFNKLRSILLDRIDYRPGKPLRIPPMTHPIVRPLLQLKISAQTPLHWIESFLSEGIEVDTLGDNAWHAGQDNTDREFFHVASEDSTVPDSPISLLASVPNLHNKTGDNSFKISVDPIPVQVIIHGDAGSANQSPEEAEGGLRGAEELERALEYRRDIARRMNQRFPIYVRHAPKERLRSGRLTRGIDRVELLWLPFSQCGSRTHFPHLMD